MPRFHFHLHKGARHVRDEQGWEFPDLVAASETAIRGIRAIVSEDAAAGAIDLNGYVEVTDAQGDPLVTIAFSDAVTVAMPGWPVHDRTPGSH